MNSKRHISGFTLVEIMTVVAIIGVVAAIAIPSAMKSWVKARVTSTISDLRAFEQALKSYNLENGEYPQFSMPPDPVVVWGVGMLPPPLEGYSDEKDWVGTTPCGGNYYLSTGSILVNGKRRRYMYIFNGKPALLRELATELNASTTTNVTSKAYYWGGNDWLLYFIESLAAAE